MWPSLSLCVFFANCCRVCFVFAKEPTDWGAPDSPPLATEIWSFSLIGVHPILHHSPLKFGLILFLQIVAKRPLCLQRGNGCTRLYTPNLEIWPDFFQFLALHLGGEPGGHLHKN